MSRIRIGTDDFRELRQENGYFVDKSPLIRAVLDGSKCLLLPRPRRFGKTLNLSMLRYFFERTEGESRRPLYEDLAIARDAEAMTHQGRYPVIHLSLKSIKGGDWEVARHKLIERLAKLHREHLGAADGLDPESREVFSRLASGTASQAELESSLTNLIDSLYAHHGQPVIVLIDEYDTPIIEARSKGYYTEMIEFMRAWLGEGLKRENSQALYRAVVTGILRVAKESLFSGLNNLATWSMLRPGPFADKFGFTQEEVDALVADFGVPDLAGPIREWYNGYSFGGVTIYNPWSVLNAIEHHPAPIAPHWLNTASNQLVYEELEAGGLPLKRDLEKLLAGEELRYPIDESVTFGDVGVRPEQVWSFLYFAGYLRADLPDYDFAGRLTYALSIPNREVQAAYRVFVERAFHAVPDAGIADFLDFFLEGHPAAQLERVLQPLVTALVSHHDTARQPEAVFHLFVLGLLASLRQIYEIRSNAEAGYGRADILLRPKTARYPHAWVIEFKSIEDGSDPETTLAAALAQIEERAYPTQLLEAGVAPEHLHRLAIVFAGGRLYAREG